MDAARQQGPANEGGFDDGEADDEPACSLRGRCHTCKRPPTTKSFGSPDHQSRGTSLAGVGVMLSLVAFRPMNGAVRVLRWAVEGVEPQRRIG